MEIQQYIHQMIADEVISGASYALFTPYEKRTFYEGVQGKMPPFSDIPLKEMMYYDLASLTKVIFTTTRILQLINEKKLCFDTKIQTILPRFQYSEITIEHLLLHRSGLPAEVMDKKTLTKENIIDRVYQTSLSYPTNTQCIYSDVGYILLGFIIKEIDGCSLDESGKRHIFKPLGMNHTGYQIQDHREKFVPTEVHPIRGLVHGIVHDSKAYLLKESGSAGLFSTLDDLVVFAQSLLNHRIFSSEIEKRLMDTNEEGRGLGWEKPYGNSILYHTGFSGTSILLDLSKKRGLILLTNRIHPHRDNVEFLNRRKVLNEIFLEEGR